MSTPKRNRDQERLHQSRRRFLMQVATVGAVLSVSSLFSDAPARAQASSMGIPGTPKPWHASESIYSGVLNLSSSNAQIIHPVVSWTGKGDGLVFDLFFNSQSSQTSALSPLGPKWTHSFSTKIIASTDDATVLWGDGTEDVYPKNGSDYLNPSGVYNSLSGNPGGGWTLFHKERRLQYQFDANGNLIGTVTANGLITSFTYTSGNLTSVTDCSGRAISLNYSNGRITSVTDYEGSIWQLSYTNGFLTSVTPPLLNGNAHPTQLSYSGSNVVGITNTLSDTWTFAYNGDNLTSTTDPANATWFYSSATAGGGGTASRGSAGGDLGDDVPIEYIAWPIEVAQISSAQDPTGASVQCGFDEFGRLVAVQGATSERAVHTYNNNNQRTSTAVSTAVAWQWTYDSAGNQTGQTDNAGDTTSSTYNSAGQVLSITEPTGKVTTFQYNSSGNRTAAINPAGNTIATSYNTAGLPVQISDPRGKVTQFAYDSRGNLTGVTNPVGGTTQFSYQGNSDRISQRVDALGRTTVYTYDDWGREIGTAYPTSGRPGVTSVLNTQGRVIQSTDATGTRTYTYDVSGRRIGMTDPMGNTQSVFDAAGRRLSQTDVAGRTHTYAYDSMKRLQSVSVGGQTTQMSYNSSGLTSLKTFPNGTQAEYTYDSGGKNTDLTYRRQSDGQVLVGYNALYNAAGRIEQITESPSGDVTVYQYDDAGRITSETRTGNRSFVGAYTYDQNGNRLSVFRSENGVASYNGSYTYDDGSRLMQATDTVASTVEQYSWNADGTLAAYPGPGYLRRLSYNEENNITQISKDYGGGNVQVAHEYGYAADGDQRWSKDYANNVWSWYPCGVGCSAGALVEKVSDLQGQNWQVSALSANANGLVERNGEYHYPNLLGAVEVVADASGNVKAHNLYDSQGTVRAQSGSAATPIGAGRAGNEGLPEKMFMIQQAQSFQQLQADDFHCARQRERCKTGADRLYTSCTIWVGGVCGVSGILISSTECLGKCAVGTAGNIPLCLTLCGIGLAAICFLGVGICNLWANKVTYDCDVAHAKCEEEKKKKKKNSIARPVSAIGIIYV